jgi:hypothetical protein
MDMLSTIGLIIGWFFSHIVRTFVRYCSKSEHGGCIHQSPWAEAVRVED